MLSPTYTRLRNSMHDTTAEYLSENPDIKEVFNNCCYCISEEANNQHRSFEAIKVHAKRKEFMKYYLEGRRELALSIRRENSCRLALEMRKVFGIDDRWNNCRSDNEPSTPKYMFNPPPHKYFKHQSPISAPNTVSFDSDRQVVPGESFAKKALKGCCRCIHDESELQYSLFSDMGKAARRHDYEEFNYARDNLESSLEREEYCRVALNKGQPFEPNYVPGVCRWDGKDAPPERMKNSLRFKDAVIEQRSTASFDD